MPVFNKGPILIETGQVAGFAPDPNNPMVRMGVYGSGSQGTTGVMGASDTGYGVFGTNGKGSTLAPSVGAGVAGESDSGIGIFGSSNASSGVQGESIGFDGVHGESQSPAHAGVAGLNFHGGFGIYGRGTPAGHFEGDVEVTGKLTSGDQHCNGTLFAQVDVVLGSDCAEDFDVPGADQVEPGTVMVIDDEGSLQASRCAYDRRVAGVISGAGNFRPGLVLGRQEAQADRLPIALAGKAYCKVDARYSPITVGDLLTSSPTPGYAMKADDPFKAFGSVIGKALLPLEAGQGLIPILIALQ